MNGFANKAVSATAKTGKQVAINVAKQIAQENLELLKKSREQVVGTEAAPEKEVQNPEAVSTTPPENYPDLEASSKAQSQRLLQALEAELAQIRRQRELRDQQRKQQEPLKGQEAQTSPDFVAPAGKQSGKIKNAFGAMKKKLTDMSSRGEKQKNVSG